MMVKRLIDCNSGDIAQMGKADLLKSIALSERLRMQSWPLAWGRIC